eukprot:TRINITY_DN38970_c0_g4_i2.p3 TRINITY_DN38970_c0_g4~~TRINITY_DN38970_c0_g4_i2.p3  ORF type:complete len:169 (-),score=0.36 TRINITY_DN38970_c0_g4_i2:302-808(-)
MGDQVVKIQDFVMIVIESRVSILKYMLSVLQSHLFVLALLCLKNFLLKQKLLVYYSNSFSIKQDGMISHPSLTKIIAHRFLVFIAVVLNVIISIVVLILYVVCCDGGGCHFYECSDSCGLLLIVRLLYRYDCFLINLIIHDDMGNVSKIESIDFFNQIDLVIIYNDGF